MQTAIHVLDTTAHWAGRTAVKVKGLQAKLAKDIVIDRRLVDLGALKLSTLEGVGPWPDDEMFLCVGPTGDVWCQSLRDLERKYDLSAEGADGWKTYTPKPEASVEFFELTADIVRDQLAGRWADQVHIQGLWGKEINGIKNLQEVQVGDMIVRRPNEPHDQWVVRRSIWENTYAES